MRRTAYCAELFEDASLVGLYRRARSPYCAIALAGACRIQTSVCTQSTDSRLNLGRAALREHERRDQPRNFFSGLSWAACSNLRIGVAGQL
jgi:hypothetical protein